MELKEKAIAKGVYEFYNHTTKEITRVENVVCQNFFNQVFEAMQNNTSVLYVTHFVTGDGTTQALKTDTALENEIFRGNVTNFTATNTQIKIKTILSTAQSNFVIKEVGLFFSDGGILSRANVNIDKNASTQYTVVYTLTLI